ncbi:MAG: FAD-binding protein, partial [Pseudobdellovibrionaceae bacterium]
MSNYTDLPEGVTREQMDVDVLIVGGGAAGLSCALHLSQQIEKHNQEIAEGKRAGEAIPEQMIVVL